MQTQLSGNNLGDVHGGLFSNNVNSISFNVHSHVWKLRRQGIFEDFATRLGRWSRNHRERTVEWDDISFLDASEVTIGDNYRIFAAVYQGIAVLVKVYEGPDSRQRIKTDLSINHSFQHPNLLRVVAACKTAQIPFIVFKTPIHSLPPEIGVFRSLTCYLAAALGDGDQECLVRAVQFMRDVSSGFSHLENMWKVKRFALSRTTFDLLVDANNNVCVSVGLIKDQEAAQRTLANEWLNVFEDLCARNLREANEECHSDFRRRLPVSAPSTDVATTLAPLPSAIEAATTPLLNLNQTGSLIQTEPLFSPQPPTVPEYPPRREYAFVPQTGSDRPSLKEINKDFARFMRNLQVGPTISSNIERLRRNLRLPTTVQHRCPGYKRQELAIATSVSRTAIISHFTPLIKEICQVCNQEVEEGIFLCPCGQADDGVASTVRCHKCLVWSHRGCHQVLIIDSLQFTCPECQQNSIGLNSSFASSSPPRPVDPHGLYVLAMHDYSPQQQNSNVLSFHAGQVIQVLNTDPSGWWDGQLEGRRGWFPSNYVNADVNMPEEEELTQTSVRRNRSRSNASISDSLGADIDSYCPPIMVPLLDGLSLLQNAVRSNRVSHFQPSTACIISCVRSILSVTDTLPRDAPILQQHPILAQERRKILSILALLVAQAKKTSENVLDDNVFKVEVDGMLRLGGQVVARVRGFLAVAVQCGVELPEQRQSGYLTNIERPRAQRSVRSSPLRAQDLRSRGLATRTSGAPVPPVPNIPARFTMNSETRPSRRNKTHKTTPSSSSSSSSESTGTPIGAPFPQGACTTHQVLDALRHIHDHYLSSIAAFIGHAHSHSRASHVSSTGHMYDLVREIIEMVCGLLTIVEAVLLHSDIPEQKLGNLRAAKEGLYSLTSDLAESVRLLTLPPTTSEEEEKQALLRSATGALRAVTDCVAAVKICLTRSMGERPLILHVPPMVPSGPIGSYGSS